MVPDWLHWLAILSLLAGGLCAAAIGLDLLRRPQPMAIMNVVWPVLALPGSLLLVWFYLRFGRAAPDGDASGQSGKQPFPAIVAKGAGHCGAGCTLGDIAAEFLALGVPAVAVWFGWHSLFEEKMFAVWVIDFIFAFALGIVFQYFAIVPMRQVGPLEGLRDALKADTLSLIAWQIGMYGFMAVAQFAIFRPAFGVTLDPAMPEFWFMMQFAMLCGFATSYPVNWWLIRRGIKEAM